MKIINTLNAPLPHGPYSQAVTAGNFLYVSGRLAINPKNGKIVSGNIADQTKRVLKNIKTILTAAGYSFESIVQTNVYLSSMATFKEFNAEYAKHFASLFSPRVAAGVVLVPDALVEISVIAYEK